MTFSQALLRRPAATMVAGITTAALGLPDYQLALAQHHQYDLALQAAGLTTTVLEALPDFPDSVFVEDCAVLAGSLAVLTRPGAGSRRGEELAIRAALEGIFSQVLQIEAPATLDGGDICQIDDHFLLGVSARTNRAGAEALAALLTEKGFSSEPVDITSWSGILHLKSAINYLGDGMLLVDERLARHPAIARYKRILVPQQEAYAANSLRVNDRVLVPAGFSLTQKKISQAGLRTVSLNMSEFQKLDGGLSCLSLRW